MNNKTNCTVCKAKHTGGQCGPEDIPGSWGKRAKVTCPMCLRTGVTVLSPVGDPDARDVSMHRSQADLDVVCAYFGDVNNIHVRGSIAYWQDACLKPNPGKWTPEGREWESWIVT